MATAIEQRRDPGPGPAWLLERAAAQATTRGIWCAAAGDRSRMRGDAARLPIDPNTDYGRAGGADERGGGAAVAGAADEHGAGGADPRDHAGGVDVRVGPRARGEARCRTERRSMSHAADLAARHCGGAARAGALRVHAAAALGLLHAVGRGAGDAGVAGDRGGAGAAAGACWGRTRGGGRCRRRRCSARRCRRGVLIDRGDDAAARGAGEPDAGVAVVRRAGSWGSR
jgi:hypothetical protein